MLNITSWQRSQVHPWWLCSCNFVSASPLLCHSHTSARRRHRLWIKEWPLRILGVEFTGVIGTWKLWTFWEAAWALPVFSDGAAAFVHVVRSLQGECDSQLFGGHLHTGTPSLPSAAINITEASRPGANGKNNCSTTSVLPLRSLVRGTENLRTSSVCSALLQWSPRSEFYTLRL